MFAAAVCFNPISYEYHTVIVPIILSIDFNGDVK